VEVCIEVVALECFGCVNTMLSLAVCTANLHVGNGSLWCDRTQECWTLHGLVNLRGNITELTYCIAYGSYMLRIRIIQPLGQAW